MANLWAVDSSAAAWVGTFNGNVPVTAEYERISLSDLSELEARVPIPAIISLFLVAIPLLLTRQRGG